MVTSKENSIGRGEDSFLKAAFDMKNILWDKGYLSTFEKIFLNTIKIYRYLATKQNFPTSTYKC